MILKQLLKLEHGEHGRIMEIAQKVAVLEYKSEFEHGESSIFIKSDNVVLYEFGQKFRH